MGKYEKYVQDFREDYEDPHVDPYISGFSGLTPDKRVKPAEISHDELGGLHGGDFSGHYHLTSKQVAKYEGYSGEITKLRTDTGNAISILRTDAFREIERVEDEADEKLRLANNATNTRIDTLRTDTDTAISGLRTEALAEINRVRIEAADELADTREDLSGDIEALRADAFVEIGRVEEEAETHLRTADEAINDKVDNLTVDTAERISRLRTDAFAEIGRVESEADSKVNNLKGYADTEIRKSEERTTAEIAGASSRLEGIARRAQEEAARAATEASTAREELTAGLSEVKGDQATLSRKNEDLNARFEEVVSGVTEDGEILDARIDAYGEPHATLGANLRNIQEELNESISDTREKIASSHEHMQEQSSTLSDLVMDEALKRREEQAQEARQREELAERLADDTGNLSAGLLNVITTLKHTTTSRQDRDQHRDTVNEELLEYMREQIDTNAYTVLRLAVLLGRKTTGGSIYVNPLDWSGKDSLAIPEPRCAVVNITGISTMPTSKTDEYDAVMEFWDMHGNYFRKPIVCSAQGQSSMGYPKKNMKFDLLNEDGTEFELKIGDWVEQDGFHLKAFFCETFRGVGIVSYKFLDEIMRFNGEGKDRPYKKALYTDGMKDLTLQLDTGALCHPDGFPCKVYLNGQFYGMFVWQLKKDRDNYHMEKSNVQHIHLDGTLAQQEFWYGAINWGAFEIRNPNKLYTMDGKKYDGDAPKELIDETSEKYDPNNKDHVRSATVKKSIQELTRKFTAAKALLRRHQSNMTAARKAELREKYGEIFDWENLRDYLIFSDIVDNVDGFYKNWQWTTYDGVKWYVNAYDLDNSLGIFVWNGNTLRPVRNVRNGMNVDNPTNCAVSLYEDEVEARYKDLREAGIISTSNILGKLRDWVLRIGIENYEQEYSKWPSSPCMVDYTDSLSRVGAWLDATIANMDVLYRYEPESVKLKRLEEAVQELIDGEGFTYEGAKVSRNAEVNAMMDDVFDGDGTGGEELSEIPEELRDRVTTAEDFNDMLDEIFG